MLSFILLFPFNRCDLQKCHFVYYFGRGVPDVHANTVVVNKIHLVDCVMLGLPRELEEGVGGLSLCRALVPSTLGLNRM